jgi:hypothetical protein
MRYACATCQGCDTLGGWGREGIKHLEGVLTQELSPWVYWYGMQGVGSKQG